jgi:hypothetical protein
MKLITGLTVCGVVKNSLSFTDAAAAKKNAPLLHGILRKICFLNEIRPLIVYKIISTAAARMVPLQSLSTPPPPPTIASYRPPAMIPAMHAGWLEQLRYLSALIPLLQLRARRVSLKRPPPAAWKWHLC